MKENLSIIGTGLIGCSIALGVKGMFRNVAGYDSDAENFESAINAGIVNQSWSINRIAFGSDVIIVSVPVNVAVSIIPYVLSKINDNAVVIDVGSTKSTICKTVRNHSRRGSFVAAHPMAGSENSGPRRANAQLLNGRKVIICEPELSSLSALNCAKMIFANLGMSIDYMDADAHDRVVALVSHLPQIVSYGVASTVAQSMEVNHQWCDLAASGFDSSTRLAKSPSNVWTPILIQNKEHIVDFLDLFIKQIETVKGFIESGDADSINQFIHQSQSVRETFDKKQISQIDHKNGNKTIVRTSTTQSVVTGVE